MLTGVTTYAFLIKALPYVIGLKVVGGVFDIGIHAVKCKIGKIR